MMRPKSSTVPVSYTGWFPRYAGLQGGDLSATTSQAAQSAGNQGREL